MCAALPPVGHAVDRRGAQCVLQWGMLLFAYGIVCSSVSSRFDVQFMGRLSTGAANSTLFSAAMALLMERFQEPLRAEHVGTALGFGTVGNLIGPPMGGYAFAVASEFAIPEPQALAFVPSALTLGVAHVALRRIPKVTSSGKALLAKPEPATDEHLLHRIFGVYTAVGMKAVVLASVLTCLFGAQSALLCAGVLEMHAARVSAGTIGLVVVPAALLQAIISRWGGKMATTARRRVALVLFSPLLLSVGFVLLVLLCRCTSVGVITRFTIAISLPSAAMAAADAASISMMAELAASHGRGFGDSMTASELAVTAGQGVGPSLGVFLLHVGNLEGLLLTLATASALVGVAFAATFKSTAES